MLEKKTTGEIIDSYLYLLKKDIVIDYSKVWVSEESLIKFYEEMWSSGNILSPNEFKNHLDISNKKTNGDK